MKAKILVNIYTKGCRNKAKRASIEREIPFLPTIGMKFESEAWKGMKTVEDFWWSVDDATLFVELNPHEVDSEAWVETHVKAYSVREWHIQ